MRKLGRSKSESVDAHTQRQPGLVGLLETMRAQLEVCCLNFLFLMTRLATPNLTFVSSDILKAKIIKL
jgi:hypothetical protein